VCHFFAPLCINITRQSIELESRSNQSYYKVFTVTLVQTSWRSRKSCRLSLVFFNWEVLDFSFFVGDVTIWEGLRNFGWGHLALGSNTKSLFWLKFLVKTRCKSISFGPLIGHLAFVVGKLWPKTKTPNFAKIPNMRFSIKILVFCAAQPQVLGVRDMSSLQYMSNILFMSTTGPKVAQRLQICLFYFMRQNLCWDFLPSFEHNRLKWSCARV